MENLRADAVQANARRIWRDDLIELFRHQFLNIAGAGPIVGPVVAIAYFGWAATFTWVILGTLSVGGVHDYLALMVSVRNGGRPRCTTRGRSFWRSSTAKAMCMPSAPVSARVSGNLSRRGTRSIRRSCTLSVWTCLCPPTSPRETTASACGSPTPLTAYGLIRSMYRSRQGSRSGHRLGRQARPGPTANRHSARG